MISVTQIGWEKRHVVSPFLDKKVQTLCGTTIDNVPIIKNIRHMDLCSKCEKMRKSLSREMSASKWKHTPQTKKVAYGGMNKIKQQYFDNIVDKVDKDISEFVFALIVELDQR